MPPGTYARIKRQSTPNDGLHLASGSLYRPHGEETVWRSNRLVAHTLVCEEQEQRSRRASKSSSDADAAFAMRLSQTADDEERAERESRTVLMTADSEMAERLQREEADAQLERDTQVAADGAFAHRLSSGGLSQNYEFGRSLSWRRSSAARARAIVGFTAGGEAVTR